MKASRARPSHTHGTYCAGRPPPFAQWLFGEDLLAALREPELHPKAKAFIRGLARYCAGLYLAGIDPDDIDNRITTVKDSAS